MKEFREQFGANTHVFLPVIHVIDTAQALRNAFIAFESGADGIFLINHNKNGEHLIQVYEKVKARLPDFWIGVNCLDRGLGSLGIMPPSTEGLWVDNCGITEDGESAAHFMFRRSRQETGWKGTLFGGVAFKYQPDVKDLNTVVRKAVKHIDVITTSGAGTGEPPTVEKIRLMKRTIGQHPLAIASGITAENVKDYLDWADCFLVATGISDSFYELSEKKTRTLARRIGN